MFGASSVLAQGHSDWTEPFPAFRIVGNVYYVGSGIAEIWWTSSDGTSMSCPRGRCGSSFHRAPVGSGHPSVLDKLIRDIAKAAGTR